MSLIRRIFDYVAPIWCGDDKKPSIRRVIAIALSIDFIINVHNSVASVSKIINILYQSKPVDAAVVASLSSALAQVTLLLGVEASLIAAMLALTTWQGTKLPNSSQQS